MRCALDPFCGAVWSIQLLHMGQAVILAVPTRMKRQSINYWEIEEFSKERTGTAARGNIWKDCGGSLLARAATASWSSRLEI